MAYSKMDKYTREYIRQYKYKGFVFYDGENRPGILRARTLEGARVECIRDLNLDDDLGIYKVTPKGITFCGDMSRANGRYKYAAGNYWEPAGSWKVYLVDPKTGKLSDAKIDHGWDGHRRAMKLRY